MASEKHLQLSSFVKEVHKNLRLNAVFLGYEDAWKRHCNNKEILSEYASAMHQLATNCWEENYKKEELLKSRITWIYNFCVRYFFSGEIFKQRKREQDVAAKISCIQHSIETHFDNTLKVLDVGSCYNPLSTFDHFDVTAIDIAPAVDSVRESDFLCLSIVNDCPVNNTNTNIYELQESSFDIVVFSLFLEYLPSPDQRTLCCKKAYEVLRREGLLIIISPDSKHVGANAKFMKSWRFILAKLGFSRIKYEKLSHVHCMAFRKSINPETASRWADIHKTSNILHKMSIPQDFHDIINPSDNIHNVKFIEPIVNYFNELPYFVND